MEVEPVKRYQTNRHSSAVCGTDKLALEALVQSESNNLNHFCKELKDQVGAKDNGLHLGLDLELPHPDHYTPETVDFPNSPSAMMKYGDLEGDDIYRKPEDAVTDSEDEQSFRAVIDLNNSVRLRKEAESSDSANSANASDAEEYFEDFHLPVTHENSMSTRRSFIRKVKSVDIRLPDATRSAGLVGEGGELSRQGSIRRKIIPLPQDFINDSFHSEKSETSPVKRTSTPNETFADLNDVDYSQSIIISSQQHPGITGGLPYRYHDVGISALASAKGSPSSDAGIMPDMTPLDEETLAKIRGCVLDVEKVKDIYTLGSRLQDLLSAAEIEEIINNSHRYGGVISQDLIQSLQALSTTANKLPDNAVFSSNLPVNETKSSRYRTDSRMPFDLVDSNNDNRPDRDTATRVQHQQVKKRISGLSIMGNMAQACDDTDDESDLPPFPPLTIVSSESGVASVQGNATGRGLPLTPDTLSKSESPMPASPDDWGIRPEDSNSAPPLTDEPENAAAIERMPKPDLIPDTSKQDEEDEDGKWRSVVISGLERKIDMKVIEPYKKVLSHGGYQGNDCQTAIIVFSACFLPDRNRADYDYVMENLFLYVLTTLDQLVAENYVLVYFHGATPKSCIPRFAWVKNCYQMIDRRLRKNLKRLYLVHPTLWLKAAVLMCRPFISSKFSRKIVYIPNLPSLSAELPMDHVCIPDRVKQLEFTLMIQDIKRRKGLS